MAARVVLSRMTGISARSFVSRSTSNAVSVLPAVHRRQRQNLAPNYNSAPARRCLSTTTATATAAAVDNTTSVTELLRRCAEEQRGLQAVVPLKSLMFLLRSQNALTWSPNDLVNLAVSLCHTAESYDKKTVWQALAPLMAAVADKLDADQLSKLLWSLQSLPRSMTNERQINNLLVSVNTALRNTAAEDWREDQLAKAAYCVPVLNSKSPTARILFRTLKARLRDAKPGDGVDAAFVAMHLQQSMAIAGRDVVDLYAALLEKCTTIRGTAPHRVPRELLRRSSPLPTSRGEVRKQWSQLNPMDAGASILALYGSQHIDVLRGTNNELCYVLYEALGAKRYQSALPLPTEPTLTGDSKDMHSVLRRLHENIGQTNTAPNTARALGTSLYGLQQLSGDVKHVRQLLSVSAQQLTDSTTDLYVQALQRTLHQPRVADTNAAAARVAASNSSKSSSKTASTGKLAKASDPTRKPSNT